MHYKFTKNFLTLQTRFKLMANICHTDFKIVGDPTEIARLRDLLTEIQKQVYQRKADKNYLWLGLIESALGKEPISDGRGEFFPLVSDDISADGTCLSLHTLSAWSEDLPAFEVIRKHFPSIKYYYWTQEPHCSYWGTNDAEGIFYPERYVASLHDEEEGDVWAYETIEDIVDEMNRMGFNDYQPTSGIKTFEDLATYAQQFMENPDLPEDVEIYVYEVAVFTKDNPMGSLKYPGMEFPPE